MAAESRSIVIFNTRGEAGAFLVYPYLFNLSGEWIGWVTPEREVFSILGYYVGFLSRDPRILRKRSLDKLPPRRTPPAGPLKFSPPATHPLAPLMPELNFDTIDILLECPEQLHTGDSGEFRADME